MASAQASGPGALIEPGDDERSVYFHGISGGRLVLRTNCHEKPWGSVPTTMRDPEYNLMPRSKAYMAVGSLSEHQVYDAQVILRLRQAYPDITKALDNEEVDWLWFSGMRIGSTDAREEGGQEFPLILYLNVAFGTTFNHVLSAVVVIKDILERVELPDVHVEVHENVLVDHAATPGLESVVEGLQVPDGKDMLEPEYQYEPYKDVGSSTMGWPICRRTPKGQEFEGTTGPFITFAEREGEIYTATCRHVIYQHDDNWTLESIKRLNFEENTSADEVHDAYMTQGGDHRLRSALERANRTNGEANLPKEFQPFYTTLVDELTKAVATTVDKRCVGRLCVVPAPEAQKEAQKEAHEDVDSDPDWVLIKLDGGYFKEARNMLYLGHGGLSRLTIYELFHGYIDGKSNLTIAQSIELKRKIRGHNLWLHMDGTHLQKPTMADGGVPVVRVVKHGMQSGLTYGLTNQVEAVVRQFPAGDVPTAGALYTWKILVVPCFPIDHHGKTGDPGWPTIFSAPGDSGAAVLDADGRFMGHVVSGGLGGVEHWDDIHADHDPELEGRWRGKVRVRDPFRPCSWEEEESSTTRTAVESETALTREVKRHFKEGQTITMVTPAWALVEEIKRETNMEPILARPVFSLPPKEKD